MVFPKENGKIIIEQNMVTKIPIINQAIESRPQRIHNASFTVINHKIPSRLNSKIKPKGALNERQKNKKISDITPSQISSAVIVKPAIVQMIAPNKESLDGSFA